MQFSILVTTQMLSYYLPQVFNRVEDIIILMWEDLLQVKNNNKLAIIANPLKTQTFSKHKNRQ